MATKFDVKIAQGKALEVLAGIQALDPYKVSVGFGLRLERIATELQPVAERLSARYRGMAEQFGRRKPDGSFVTGPGGVEMVDSPEARTAKAALEAAENELLDFSLELFSAADLQAEAGDVERRIIRMLVPLFKESHPNLKEPSNG